MAKRKMKLGLFLMGAGHHIASWRHPNVRADAYESIEFYTEAAKIAETGKLDMLFMSDGLSINELSHPSELVRFEPLTLLGALSMVTKNIGLASTASTTYNEPFHIARKFASIDHMSRGRSAWNVVTSYYEGEASNFSRKQHLDHETRYERAREFVDVVLGLWDSWDEDALVRNKETGVYFDREKLHTLNHSGTYFSVKGPLNASKSVQGHPVIIQAGSSDSGIQLASEKAEVIFTAQQTLEEAQKFYQKVKNKVRRAGRNADHVLILPGVSPIIGETEEEARAKFEELQDLIVPEVGLDFLSDYLGGIDFSKYPLDGPLPEKIPSTNGNQSRRQLIIDLARRENLTIRQLYKRVAGSRGHRIIFGSPVQIADKLEKWFRNGGADGFNLMFPYYSDLLAEFVEKVVPILQERGLFREEYEGTTLRENLGLPKPASRYEKDFSKIQ
ncbi:LLM class flavin-dependent oxidoreductase [Bacillus gobiensis]|uniref:LLM class flavin-dependent oxidoreductase n=1 Tax=Bacillus gobiensis TaxID=1441095 RepID=UPI003D1CA228